MLYDIRLELHYDYDGLVHGDRHLIRVAPQSIPGVQRVIKKLDGNFFMTDGGIETTLIFLEGQELPHFAAFELFKTPWERAVPARKYPVILSTEGSRIHDLDADLFLVYGSEEHAVDREAGIAVERVDGPVEILWGGSTRSTRATGSRSTSATSPLGTPPPCAHTAPASSTA